MKRFSKRILAVLALLAVILPLLQLRVATCSTAVELVDMSSLTGDVKIYYLETVPHRIREFLEQVGLGEIVIELRSGETISSGLIMAHAETLTRKASHYTEHLSEILARCIRCAIAVVNTDPKVDASTVLDAHSVVLKSLESIGVPVILPLSPEQPVENDKLGVGLLHSSLMTADIVVYSISPPGVIVVETVNHHDFHYVLSAILEWSGIVRYERVPDKAKIYHNTILSGPTNMVFLGFIGWITNYTYGSVCGEVTGRQFIHVRFYYGNTTSATGTLYHVWYVHTQHSGAGYKSRCCLWGFICYDNPHYPRLFDTIIHWRTDTWSGQILDDWSPKNAGSARRVAYSMTAGPSAGTKDMSVTVEYSTGFTTPGSPYFRWENYNMDPAAGLVRVRHWVERGNYTEDRLTNLVFTVVPSSFGFLDPAKPGGHQPLAIMLSFYMELNTRDNVNITFSASLYSS